MAVMVMMMMGVVVVMMLLLLTSMFMASGSMLRTRACDGGRDSRSLCHPVWVGQNGGPRYAQPRCLSIFLREIISANICSLTFDGVSFP